MLYEKGEGVMRKGTKIWLIVAASLIVLGAILFVGAMTMIKWNFTSLATDEYETNTHEIGENFENISIDTNTADVSFLPSESEGVRVVCYEDVKCKHKVEVINGTLTVAAEDTRQWYDHISIFHRAPKIFVYLPEGAYGSLTIKESTGDVEVPKDFSFTEAHVTLTTGDVRWSASVTDSLKLRSTTGKLSISDCSAETAELSVTTGNVTVTGVSVTGDVSLRVNTGKARLTDLTCRSLFSEGDTGDLVMKNVIAAEDFSLKRSTGDVTFEGCDASEIRVTTDTGDVRGSLLSEKVFLVDTDTGRKEVPNTVTGGRCEITTDTGDIKITIS